jgi:hypothetical protein
VRALVVFVGLGGANFDFSNASKEGGGLNSQPPLTGERVNYDVFGLVVKLQFHPHIFGLKCKLNSPSQTVKACPWQLVSFRRTNTYWA